VRGAIGRRAAFLAAVALGATAPLAADFLDPLDAPSEPSALAPLGLLTAVTAAGPRLVAVGERGHVVASDDGGASWTQAAVPVSTDLTAVSFPSARRGWAVGHGGVVLATADGGRTWAKQLDGRDLGPRVAAAGRGDRAAPGAGRDRSPGNADDSLLDVWFEDERSGFAVGAFGRVLRTEDGGRSWTPWQDRVENPRGLHLHAIRRAAGAVWIVGEQGLVLVLDPAARRFRAVPVPYRGSFFGIAGDDRNVIVFGLRGRAYRSRDRGATWERLATGVDEALTGADLLPDGRIVLVTGAGRLLVGADAGSSFSPARAVRGAPLSAVVAAGADAVALAGAGGVSIERIRGRREAP
jgi:photosystem II stability/assembly factor-like uncharacterized protein